MKKNLVNACFVLLFFLSFACKFRAIVLLNNPKNPFYMKEIQPFIKIIDGVPHKFNTKEEYYAFKGIPMPKKKRKKKSVCVTSISIMKDAVDDMVKAFEISKSFEAIDKHGYRQWGTIYNEIMRCGELQNKFDSFTVQCARIREMLGEIEKYAKDDSTSHSGIFDKAEQLGYLYEDLKAAMCNLIHEIHSTDVLNRYKGLKPIEENGRRLGLRELAERFNTASDKYAFKWFDTSLKQMVELAKKGKDAFEYVIR